MTLIKSISGIRGTIGGETGENFTPLDIVSCTAGYGEWIRRHSVGNTVIIGRDGRISGELVASLVISTLRMMGLNVINAGLTTTPTVEMAVTKENAAGGIILTASHNPKEWNALKLLNAKGEFLSANDGALVLDYADRPITFCSIDEIGSLHERSFIKYHIEKILSLEDVDSNAIQSAHFHVIVDCVNSTGGVSIPPLLDMLGVGYQLLNAEVNGQFAHNPEPLEKNLGELIEAVSKSDAILGIAVDPDVDRLALVSENGEMFGEEYTLVAVADYILSRRPGNTVSNLSSTRALQDITEHYGGKYTASAVGEVNVVEQMKQTNAVIGGEGNGGIIVPELHYGRDALAGIALILSLLATRKTTPSELKQSYPAYFMSKQKLNLDGVKAPDVILAAIQLKYAGHNVNDTDGIKIMFEQSWVHMRKSNTEPIIRIYTEAPTQNEAEQLANRFVEELKQL